MDIPPIRTEQDLDRALAEIERYFDAAPEPGSNDAKRFQALADAIKKYEDEHWPVDLRSGKM